MPDISSQVAPDFLHSVLIIDSDQDVQRILVPAVRRALAEADGVLVAVSDDTANLLGEELGAVDGKLEWGDTSVFYQRLGFAYEGFRRLLAARHAAGRRIHVFAEPNVDSDADEGAVVDRAGAYLAYEAMVNESYADYGCEVTCLWDARRHPTLLIENVRSLHNHELGPTGQEPSPGFVDPGQYLAGRNQLPLPLPARVERSVGVIDPDGLPMLRAELRNWAQDHGFAPFAASDVLLAVNEIATNGLTHGQPPVHVYGWCQRDTLVVQIDDQGGTPLPPSAGYLPPIGPRLSEGGVWLARQLADILQTHTAGTTTSVRLYFPHQLTHRTPARLRAAR